MTALLDYNCADLSEVMPSHAEILARNARWAMYRRLRVAKGRPEYRVTYQQYDHGQHRLLAPTVAPDPMFDLYVARAAHLRDRNNERFAMNYGALCQRVVSPVHLP